MIDIFEIVTLDLAIFQDYMGLVFNYQNMFWMEYHFKLVEQLRDLNEVVKCVGSG